MIGRYPSRRTCCGSPSPSSCSRGWAGLLAGIVRARQIRSGASIRATSEFSARRASVISSVGSGGRGRRRAAPAALADTPGPWRWSAPRASPRIVGRLIGPFIGRPALRPGRQHPAGAGARGDSGRSVLLRRDRGRLRRVGRVHAQPVPRRLLDHPVLPARCRARARTAIVAAARPDDLHDVHRTRPRRAALRAPAPRQRALGFFVPSNLAPSTATRAIVVFTLFTAAYMAEIIRGGLQSVPRDRSRRPRPSACPPPGRPATSCCRRRCAMSSRPRSVS